MGGRKVACSATSGYVFRLLDGHWQVVTGGTAIDEGGQEPVPKAVLEGEP
jgi:hypothetical protein